MAPIDRPDHLGTDHLQNDLAGSSVRGSVVTLIAAAAKFVASIGATIVLARLLRPDDFGLMALALVTVEILARLKDAGLFTATVYSRHVTHEQATTLFWMSAGLAAAAALATVAIAPAVGWFYRDTRLVSVTAALAAVPLLDGLALQLEAVMSRQMRFIALAVMDAGALAAGVVISLLLAWAGAGYWALVGQEIFYSAIYTSAIWTVCGWLPGRPRRGSGVRPLVAFGLHLSGYRILNYLAMNLDTAFVGRFWGPQQAGIYDRAYRVITTPSTLLNSPLSTVAVPALSRLQGDAERYRTFYRAWIQFVFGLTMPLVAFLFVDTERAILTILGAGWIGIAPIYRVLAPAAFIGRFNVVTNWLYVTTGRTDRQLRWSAILLVPMIIAYGIGVAWGALGVAIAHTAVTCLLWYPGVAYCCRTAPVDPVDVCSIMVMPATAAVGAGLGLLIVRNVLPHPAAVPIAFLLDLGVYATLYLGAWVVVPVGRRNLAQFIVLARDAIAARPTALRPLLPSAGQSADKTYVANRANTMGPVADEKPR
jgi:O-antigen/teichoic acid export membrane protein